MNQKSSKSSAVRTAVKLSLCIVALFLLIFVFLDRVIIADLIKGYSFSPSAEMAEIRDSLDLTSDGLRIFNATHPVLEERDAFNRDCDSHDSEVSVLGCFSDDQVFVYDIDSSELAGIRESTTAHELLHAIWSRLSGLEKNQLVPLLEVAYSENKSSLEETLNSYDESERLDELYVRAATQLSSLSPELESHYKKYFNNRAELVEFYKNYITPFENLRTEIENLSLELENLNTEIETRRSDYEARLAAFNEEVKSFQNCASTLGCFSSEAAFNAKKRELLSVSDDLDRTRDELNALITTFNEKLSTYNENVLKSSDLQSQINSNSEITNIE